ncbi:MAG: nitrate ABC transporter substrate-binding protein [Pelotomaculum sp.]|uniref:ABC-type nitrate/sulfonate/bicarbonate transport system, periplasmic components n=1 Tax=Pelotomaculum thermopropionicum (strain DSM 13744 / JCM 10971 / SI) TaxID=370438 RepID=A5D4T3_PELTS|nr:nitrate ABC transporter substrate-binding protein [Pelotomaculum sp.]BAF58756.1 ABC-type nitrate/sulfonate/bicarbonate transport system, periplasmic components [Pelotomaculum thermopropionicum SI]
MVEAQSRMQTDKLMALMIMAALVGYGIDRVIQLFNRSITKWRFVQ